MKALAHLLPALAETISPRLRKRLDGDPGMARSWDWSRPGQVVTPNQETVTLELHDGVLRSLEDLRCGCLMAPACLHRLAVLSALEPVLEEGAASPTEEETAEEPAETLSEKQREAASRLWESGARLLERGASGAGVLDLAEIQRAAFACKELGLHRAGSAGTRVARDLRDLRCHSQAFSLDGLAEDLRELLLVAHRLRQGDAGWKGTARRRYDPIGNLKLFGLYSRPVITTSGYAGCITVLGDATGRRYEISDVMPGEPSRAVAVYAEAGKTLPGLTVSHQELSGLAVLLQNGTASAEGRLGSGSGVRAALAGKSRWEEQLVLEASVLGLEGDSVVGESADGPFRIAAIDHPALPTRDNLELLARWPERPLRLMGERHPTLERTFLVHAFEAEVGRFNLALDRLRPACFPDLLSRPRRVSLSPRHLPFADFSRRLLRLVQGGRSVALPDPVAMTAWSELGLSCGDFWLALVEAAILGSRDLRGLWVPSRSDDYALAWLSAMQYQQNARSCWLDALWQN